MKKKHKQKDFRFGSPFVLFTWITQIEAGLDCIFTFGEHDRFAAIGI